MAELLAPALFGFLCFTHDKTRISLKTLASVVAIGAIQAIIIARSVQLHTVQLVIPLLLAMLRPLATKWQRTGARSLDILIVGWARLAAITIVIYCVVPYFERVTQGSILSPMSLTRAWQAHAQALALSTISPDLGERNRLLKRISESDVNGLVVLSVPTSLYSFSHKYSPTGFLRYPNWHDKSMYNSVVSKIERSSPLIVVNKNVPDEIWPDLLFWVKLHEIKIDTIGPYDLYMGLRKGLPDDINLTSITSLFKPETSAGEWIWRNYLKIDATEPSRTYLFQHPPYGSCVDLIWSPEMMRYHILNILWKRREGYERELGSVSLQRLRAGHNKTLFSSEFGDKNQISFQTPIQSFMPTDKVRFCTKLAHGNSFSVTLADPGSAR